MYKSYDELYNNFGKGIYFKAVNENEQIIGILCASFFSKNHLKISHLFITEYFRNEGIASKLLSELEYLCPCNYYEVYINSNNDIAISFFIHNNYIQYNSTQNYISLKKEKNSK